MIIFGYAATCQVDERGTHFLRGTLEQAMPAFMESGAPVRVKHLPSDEAPDVGRVADYIVNGLGLFVVVRITDKEIATHLIGTGLFDRFSVAGNYTAMPDGSITRIALEEISITDLAAGVGTEFQIWRGQGKRPPIKLLFEEWKNANRKEPVK